MYFDCDTSDGRVVIDGEVKKIKQSEELWADVLKRHIAMGIRNKSIARQRSQSACDGKKVVSSLKDYLIFFFFFFSVNF